MQGLDWEQPIGRRKEALAHRPALDYPKDLYSETHSMYPLFYLTTFETLQAFLFLFLTVHKGRGTRNKQDWGQGSFQFIKIRIKVPIFYF